MPTDGNTQTNGILDRLSTEQLLDLMREDFESSESGDSELTDRILEVIEQREKEKPTGLFSDVDQAWADFQKYYNTPDSEDCPMNPMGDSEQTAVGQKKNRRLGHGRLLKRLVPVAAVAAVTFSSMAAVQAFGFNIFGALARWTAETFHFVSETPASAGNPESEALQQKVQEAFDSCGVTIPAPAWYPEGTELAEDIQIIDRTEVSIATCLFTYGDKNFCIEAQQYHGEERILMQTFEKDTLDVEPYYSNGRAFYIMSNMSDNRAIYSKDQTVFTINGNLPLENMKQIINSIGA